MTRSLLSVLLLCLAFLSLTQAVTIKVRTELDIVPAERELSNGERMARGLGPNKPRRLYEPTAVRPRDSAQSPSAVDPNVQLQNVAVGSATTPGGRKRGLLSYLKVLNSGILSTTTDQSVASLFIVPTTNGVMRWVPQSTGGGFVTGLGYPMYASGDAINAAASLMFSPTLPANAITNLFGSSPFAGGFAPRIGNQALQFMMSSAGQMYMAASLALAQAVIQDLQIMAVQSFIQGQLASIAQAQQAYRAATVVALPNPVRVWAQSSDGSVQGWAVCLSGGNGCLQIAVGNQGDPGTTFYLPSLGASQSFPQPMLAQADYVTTTVIANQIDAQTGLLYSAQGMDTASTRVPNELTFSVPPSGKGQIYPLQSYIGSFAVSSGNRLLYACGPGGCSGVTSPVTMCAEVVPLGGTPSVCAAQAAANAAAAADRAKRINPTQLYVTQISGANSAGDAPISGWINTDSGNLVVNPSQSAATTFYFPQLGFFSPSYSDSNGVLKVSQALINSNAGYAAGIGRPMMVPQSNNLPLNTLGWMSLTSTNGGIIKPVVYWNSAAYSYGLFYQKSQNSLVLAYDMTGALKFDPNMVQVCVESVTPGQQPTGACQPYVAVQTRTFPKCSTQINSGGVSYARMTLYDSMANSLGASYDSAAASEDQCLASCNTVNRSKPGTCTGAFYLPLGVNGNYNKSCFLRGLGNRWQKSYIASQRGAGQWLIGKCSDFVNGASGVPADMLDTCCDNPATS